MAAGITSSPYREGASMKMSGYRRTGDLKNVSGAFAGGLCADFQELRKTECNRPVKPNSYGPKHRRITRELTKRTQNPAIVTAASQRWHRDERRSRSKPLSEAETHLKAIEDKLEMIAKSDARIQRVMQIDGVGRVTAEAIVAFIDDPDGFQNKNQVSAYTGMVPRHTKVATPIGTDGSLSVVRDYCERCWSNVPGVR